MSYPQQPGNWPEQSWPSSNQPYSDPGYGAYPGYPGSAAPGGPMYGYGPPMQARPTNGLAIASLVTSLAGLLLMCGVPGIVGAIMGHAARRQIRERGEDGDGMALAGVIIGWISFGLLIAGVVILVVLPLLGYALLGATSDTGTSGY